MTDSGRPLYSRSNTRAAVWSWSRQRTRPRSAMVAVAALALMVLSGCASTMDRAELATEYYNLGSAFFDLGDLERSADYFTRALEFDPSLARASYNLARVYVLQGRFADAEKILVDLRSTEPENTIVLETLGYVAYSRGDLDTAGSFYDEVLEIDPGNADALYNRALIADETGDLELAAGALRRAVALNERDATVLGLLALVEEKLGNVDDAIAALETLKELGEAESESALRLAGLYETAQRYDRALEELDAVVGSAEDPAVRGEAEFLRARILLTAAQEPETGLQALAAAFDAGFADSERVSALLESPGLVAAAEVNELVNSYRALEEPEVSDPEGETETVPVDSTDENATVIEPPPIESEGQ